jgi:hypothetical protein
MKMESTTTALVGSRWLYGRSKLQFGDSHMVAFVCHHDPWLKWRPLHASVMALVQPPVRRPFEGFSAASSGLPPPSGCVLGEKKDGRRWNPGCVGGEGLDCVPFLCSRVLSVNLHAYVVIFSFYVSCVLCNPTDVSIMQL